MKIALCVVCDIPLNRNMAPTEKWRHTITGQVNFRLDLVLTYLSVQSNTIRIPNRNFRQCQFGLIEIYVHIFVLFSCSTRENSIHCLQTLKRMQFSHIPVQLVIVNPWKAPWNWIAFSQNSFVMSPGLFYHVIRRP